MNKWQQLEEQLKGVFGSATILADGHEVIFQKRLDGEKLVIQVGVDGWIKGTWHKVDEHGNPEHPEGRFWRPMKRRAWQLKQYKELKKVFGKKKADEMTALRTVAFSPYWGSPRPLISHLKRHFPDLELKRDEVTS
ncbi:hypothetical protein [Halomonas sp. JS92-SW72]|uniref:hypothetical protein n=1 Tax=Halomonas sp. JS92-SW72 TaxID=2306583 RepID=UPI000E5AA015|nr:hypothetical protein [Halomonas sp. JS92-SW72]AXY41618.1 hypothetical protein D1793_05080 [Halomonas sp. JS92-SW72]